MVIGLAVQSLNLQGHGGDRRSRTAMTCTYRTYGCWAPRRTTPSTTPRACPGTDEQAQPFAAQFSHGFGECGAFHETRGRDRPRIACLARAPRMPSRVDVHPPVKKMQALPLIVVTFAERSARRTDRLATCSATGAISGSTYSKLRGDSEAHLGRRPTSRNGRECSMGHLIKEKGGAPGKSGGRGVNLSGARLNVGLYRVGKHSSRYWKGS